MSDVFAGQIIRAADNADHESRIDTLESHILLTAYCSSDSSAVANDSTVNDDPELFIPVPSTGTYAIDGYLVWYCTSTTPDLRAAWSMPSGATIPWWSIIGPNSSATGAVTSGDWAAVAGSSEHGRATANAAMSGIIRGMLVLGGTAGNLTFRWSQVTSDAASITRKRGSWITLTKVA